MKTLQYLLKIVWTLNKILTLMIKNLIRKRIFKTKKKLKITFIHISNRKLINRIKNLKIRKIDQDQNLNQLIKIIVLNKKVKLNPILLMISKRMDKNL